MPENNRKGSSLTFEKEMETLERGKGTGQKGKGTAFTTICVEKLHYGRICSILLGHSLVDKAMQNRHLKPHLSTGVFILGKF